MTNSNLQGRSSRKVKTVLKGSSAISALKFGLSLVVFTVFLVACPQPAPAPTPGPTPVATVDPPTFDPATGATPTRARDAELTINHPNREAIIRYNAGTSDVANPTVSGNTGGMTYDPQNKPTFGELSPAGGMLTVKAIAIVSGTSSTVAEATYMVAVPPVIISATEITAVEEGADGTYTVVLLTAPTATVTINVATTSSAISIDPSTLMFSTSDWSMPQTVTAEATVDANYDDEMATITHEVATTVGVYTTDLTLPSVTVTTDDNDIPVRISETAITAAEGDADGTTYTVVLLTAPTDTVTINVMEDSDAITISSSSLMFSTSDWSMPQTVTVTAEEDSDSDNEMATITHSVAANVGRYTTDITLPSVEVTTQDNDIVRISETAITAVEEGADGTYTVSLRDRPAAGKVVVVRIGITGADSDAISVEPTDLWFGSTNSSTAQTVTVTAEDDDDSNNETPMITHSLTPPTGGNPDPIYYDADPPISIPNVEVTTQDNDIVAISATEITVMEGDMTGIDYMLTLQRQPATGTAVLVKIEGNDPAIAVSPSAVQWFTSTPNWDDPISVTVTAVDDGNSINEMPMITHTLVTPTGGVPADPDYYSGVSFPSVAVTVLDNNPGLRISESTLNIDESGTGSYTVGLNTEPTATVILTPDYSRSVVTVSPTVLYLSAENWDSSATTVTVIPARDADVTDASTNIMYTISSTDPNYSGLPNAVVAVNVNDDVAADVTLGASTLTVNGPADTRGMYSVMLNTQPMASVTVTARSGTTTIATILGALTFTTTNWETPQMITVISKANGESVITHTTSSSDANFDGLTVEDVTVTVSGISTSR